MSRTGVAEKLHEGWLTKSPPSNRIIRCRWRKRWFSLHCGELPGQYQLTYYTDRNCRKLKGVIDLDRCEQVDIGLKYEDKKLKFDHMLSIKTPSRTYYLAADSEQEMKNWVKYICEVCNLKSSEEEETPHISSMSNLPRQVEATTTVDVMNENRRQSASSSTTVTPNNSAPVTPLTPTTNPYIHISECVTGRLPMDGPSYLNLPQDFYDQPRSLQAPSSMANYCNLPPPHSPAGSDAVFEDDSHTATTILPAITIPQHQTDDGATATQLMPPPPPRPPKPTAMPSPKPTYFNLTELLPSGEKTNFQDDMYDFPRSHQLDGGETVGGRHCYNNAAPINSTPKRLESLVGEIFTYDCQSWATAPKTEQPSDATNTKSEPPINLEDSATSDQPAPPHTPSTPTSLSHSHPTTPNNSLPPVHRDLKPPPSAHRKLSESSFSGDATAQQQPGSPAPEVDRRKKPAKLLLPDVTQVQMIRAAPSPQPPTSGKSFETLHSDYKQAATPRTMLEYLDLDKAVLGGAGAPSADEVPRSPGTTYKVVDFVKTNAFKITRDNLEQEKLKKQHNTLALVTKK